SGTAGRPALCASGTTSSGANGNWRIASPRVSSLAPGGWTPWRKVSRPSQRSFAIARSVVRRAARDPACRVLERAVGGSAGVDHPRRAALGGLDQIGVGAGGRVLDVGLAVLSVREHLRIEADALVAGGALRRIDPGRDELAGGPGSGRRRRRSRRRRWGGGGR